jgi:hypothetical protein
LCCNLEASVEIELRYFDDCPNWRTTSTLLESLIAELGLDTTVHTRKVDTAEEAEALEFRGSPTVMINGEDPFADPDAPFGLACRIYRTDTGFAGAPSAAQLRDALTIR